MARSSGGGWGWMGGFTAPSDSPQPKRCRGEGKGNNKGSSGLTLSALTLFGAGSRFDAMPS